MKLAACSVDWMDDQLAVLKVDEKVDVLVDWKDAQMVGLLVSELDVLSALQSVVG